MNIILAPHIDDELIGCYSLIKDKKIDKVIYFFDTTEKRKKEANMLAKVYDFEPFFVRSVNFCLREFSIYDVLYVPHQNDNHPHHKIINQFAKNLHNEKKYYSIDMNTKFNILDDGTQKKVLLDKYYKSQKKLWKNDAKYYLFESIQDSDVITYINVKTNFIGYHSYPAAPAEVSFLKHTHRHVFYVNVTIQVFNDDRDIEFFMLQKELNDYIQTTGDQLNNKSCEMIAKDFLQYINVKYQNRNVIIEVSEDNENSAIVQSILWR